jgi:hypothetical protein
MTSQAPSRQYYSTGQIFFWSAVHLLLGIGTIYLTINATGIPRRDSLQTASGTVAWTWSGYMNGFRFGLVGEKRSFVYSSKGNMVYVVQYALERTDHPVVSVLYDGSHTTGPIWDKTYFSVYEVSIGRERIRSYDDVNAAWNADNRVGTWLGGAFVLSGLLLLWCAIRQGKAT